MNGGYSAFICLCLKGKAQVTCVGRVTSIESDEAGIINLIFHLHPSSRFSSSFMVRQQSSAAGVLALLQEPDPIFKQHALKALSPLVPQFWAEISEHIGEM